MILKKIIWTLKRHPFLYLMRFKLLSNNSSVEDIEKYNYNRINSKDDIPDFFFEVNKLIFENGKPDNDLDLVKQIIIWLQENIKGGPGLSEPSDKALKIMLDGKGGVCSDRAQILNNFCVINGIRVREWGATRAPFNQSYGGHSFNEVYSNELKKWILVDASYSVMFYFKNDIPLSVIELYELIRNNEDVVFKSFNNSKKLKESNVRRNFLDTNTTPFLICNYSNKVYDKSLRFSRPYIPVFVTHFVLYVIGKSYHYKFPLDDYKNIFS